MIYLIGIGVFLLLLLVLGNKGSRRILSMLLGAVVVTVAALQISKGADEYSDYSSTYLYGSILVFVILAAVGLYAWQGYNRQGTQDKQSNQSRQHLLALKAEYEAAIISRDKLRVLQSGRAYYAALRGGLLTAADEQAIANDLNAIS